MDNGYGCTVLQMYLITLNHQFKNSKNVNFMYILPHKRKKKKTLPIALYLWWLNINVNFISKKGMKS